MRLLQAIEEFVGVAKFDLHLWELETDLAVITGDHDTFVGFAVGQPISFTRLCEFRLDQTFRDLIVTGMPPPDADRALREAEVQMRHVGRPALRVRTQDGC